MKPLQLTAVLLALFATIFSTSCAATKGFGQDLQKVGNRIENRADATGGAQPEAAAVPPVPTRSTGIY